MVGTWYDNYDVVGSTRLSGRLPITCSHFKNYPPLALKHGNTQPLLIPLSDDVEWQDARKITVHLAISDSELERAALNLLGRNAKFSVVKGPIGYAAEADVRIINQAPDPEQQRALNEITPPKLLFIGVDQTEAALLEAARAGAWAFVPETADIETLENAILAVAGSVGSPLLRQIAASDSSASAVLAELSTPRSEPIRAYIEPSPLTDREIEILNLIAQGESSRSIGDIVGLGEQTIKNYVLKILEKTHTRNRAHAAALAAQRGWISTLDTV